MTGASDVAALREQSALQIKSEWKRPVAVGSWPLAGEPDFAESNAYRIFKRELRRYLLEEVSGRSFLIAGHRGAGKTALVTQAVRLLRTECIQSSVDPAAARAGRRMRLQRPLIVKLVGQSLIAPPPKRLPRAGCDSVAGNAGTSAPIVDPPGMPPPRAPVSHDDGNLNDSPSSQAESALVHITIALYRALAHELAEGCSIHARDALTDIVDKIEVAAQLALDLDNAPNPSLLRRRWSQIGRLTAGVLWPAEADNAMKANGVTDQGFREIVAAATAAQAFQICLGEISLSEKSVETAKRALDVSGSLDLKDVLQRLGAVFAGTAAAGIAAANNAQTVPAIGAGFLVWLATAAVLSWKGARSRSTDQSVNYTFMRDRSVQTLDRDLPLVIERIRDAGLAPVFVIDELDKLEDPNSTIKAILDRLKHLMADYGFFCFLTDRAYFDSIERLIATEAYPTEHTYFSQRLLVIIGPLELFDYMTALFAREGRTADDAAIAIFSLSAIFVSKLNFSELTRDMSRKIGPDGALLVSPADLRKRSDLRLAATLQLACDEILRKERYAARFQADPTFAQLAIDALYYIARAWEEAPGAPIDLSEEALETYLLRRSYGRGQDGKPVGASDGCPATPSQPNDEAGFDHAEPDPPPVDRPVAVARISPADLQMATELVQAQIPLLVDFDELLESVGSRPGSERWNFADIILRETGEKGLICGSLDGQEYSYRFVLDESGMPLDKLHRKAWLGGDRQVAVRHLSEVLTAFKVLLSRTQVTVDQLVSFGLLPATLTHASILSTQKVLSRADLVLLVSDELEDALKVAGQLEHALDTNARELSSWLILLEALRVPPAGSSEPLVDPLQAMARYLGRASSREPESRAGWILRTLLPDFVVPALNTTEGLKALSMHLDQMKQLLPPPLSAIEIEQLWAKWRQSVLAWMTQPDGAATIDFADLRAAVVGAGSGPFFRAEANAMTIRDWSALALAAVPQGASAGAPPWGLFAGLRGLGFNIFALHQLWDEMVKSKVLQPSDADAQAIKQMLTSGGPRPAGYVLRDAPGSGVLPELEKPGDLPVLVVAADRIDDYSELFDRMTAAGLLEGVIDASQ